MSNNRNKSKSGGKKGMVAAIILIWVIIISIIVAIIIFMKKDSNDEGESTTAATTTEESTDITSLDDIASYTDAETYFNDYSEVLSTEKADESATVLNEADTKTELEDRGFSDYEVETHYSMNGEYYEEDQEISADSTEKHPMYETYYVNSSDEVWLIYVINDKVFAAPVSYNIDSSLGKQVVVSESESVVSYDATTNTYYETIPDESELFIITEDKIDTGLLDSLTKEKIDEYTGQ